MIESLGPSITIKIKLEKFNGDVKPGDEPVEIIEREHTFTDPLHIQRIIKDIQHGNDE